MSYEAGAMVQLKSFKMTEDDFERFRKIINQSSGIFFDRGKWNVLRMGLSDRALARGVDSLHDYYELLTTEDKREEELRSLLENLSVQETQFFRNLPQFDALRKYIVPEVMRRKAAKHRNIHIWSAGCSTGQEPYSLAMSLLDVIPDIDSWDIRITGTDLNRQVLEVANRGWYPERKLTGLDRAHVENYMDEDDGGYRVREEIKQLVNFRCLNLVTDPLPIEAIGTCDIIFCRNVIIYFTHETAKFVIEHFFDILNPGGYLFLGHSETLWKMSTKYSLVEVGDTFIYKKSLPRGINGRRFIPDRRMRDGKLPEGIERDRRVSDRRLENIELKAREGMTKDGGSERGGTAAPADDNNTADAWLEEAKTLLELGEFVSAAEVLESRVNQGSVSAEAQFLLGLALERLGSMAEAQNAYHRTIQCDEKYSIAYFHLASILEHEGQPAEAVKEYRNAAKFLRRDESDRWEKELDDFGVESLVDLCEWKIENLGSMEN
jgi:chemotaxis protein methyltransferase CheR